MLIYLNDFEFHFLILFRLYVFFLIRKESFLSFMSFRNCTSLPFLFPLVLLWALFNGLPRIGLFTCVLFWKRLLVLILLLIHYLWFPKLNLWTFLMMNFW